jgi:hypothetical protein
MRDERESLVVHGSLSICNHIFIGGYIYSWKDRIEGGLKAER